MAVQYAGNRLPGVQTASDQLMVCGSRDVNDLGAVEHRRRTRGAHCMSQLIERGLNQTRQRCGQIGVTQAQDLRSELEISAIGGGVTAIDQSEQTPARRGAIQAGKASHFSDGQRRPAAAVSLDDRESLGEAAHLVFRIRTGGLGRDRGEIGRFSRRCNGLAHARRSKVLQC